MTPRPSQRPRPPSTCGPATARCSSASAASAWRRPRSTTSPARPGARAPRSTATSTASPRSCAARSVAEHERVAGVRGRRPDAPPPTFADAVVAVVVAARARAARPRRAAVPPRPRARGGARPPRVRPRRPSSSSRWATRSRPRSTAGSTPDDATRAGDWLARIVRSYVLDAAPAHRLHRPDRRRAFLEQLVIPGLAEAGSHDRRLHRHHRSRRHQRPRGDPRGHQHRRRRGRSTRSAPTPTRSSRGTTSAAGPRSCKLYEKAKTSQWNANDLDWDIEVDQEKVARDEPEPERHSASEIDLTGTPFEKWGDKEWIEFGDRVAELDALAVHARRAGRADLHRADRRDRAVDRRQVLRGDAGDGRGPPRRGVRASTSTRSCRATTRSTRTSRCCSTTSSPTAAGT